MMENDLNYFLQQKYDIGVRNALIEVMIRFPYFEGKTEIIKDIEKKLLKGVD